MGRKAKKDLEACCCGPDLNVRASNCKVEAIVSIDERGQMVLPKELRDKAGIKPGDKLVAVSCSKDGGIYCISLIKSEYFMGMLNETLGPVMDELTLKKD